MFNVKPKVVAIVTLENDHDSSRTTRQAFQIALAISDEVADLEAAGCKVIQVDEPALREGLPLKPLKKAGKDTAS